MKVVILCGGQGMRIREETEFRPKPMIEIGGRPILWHIMKIYSHFGYHDFVLCLGYKGDVIRKYFMDYSSMNCDITVDLANPHKVTLHGKHDEAWRVTLAETGLHTMTAGRIKKIQAYVSNDEHFMMTYGDGVADVDIAGLLEFHKHHRRVATVTAVRPSSRWGELMLEGDEVAEFREKPQLTGGFVNGGFFVLSRRIFDFLDDDPTVPFERAPMQRLSQERELLAYVHEGFWQAMDTRRDLEQLNELWNGGAPPWRVWER